MSRRFFNAAILILLAIAIRPAIALAQEAATKAGADDAKRQKTIGLAIEFPGEVELRYKAIAFEEGMTVLDALLAAAKHERPLKFKSTGSGEFAFLTEIEGLKNEGAAGKNWTYKVDGQRAKVGMGSMKLKAGNQVVWIFAK